MNLEKMKREEERIMKEYREKKLNPLLEEMKKCPNCKESELAFKPCGYHFEKLESLSKELSRNLMEIKLKIAMHPEEAEKELEKIIKALQQKRD